MVLMRIIAPVGEDQIRCDAQFQRFQTILQLCPLVGEESILEGRRFYIGTGCALEESRR